MSSVNIVCISLCFTEKLKSLNYMVLIRTKVQTVLKMTQINSLDKDLSRVFIDSFWEWEQFLQSLTSSMSLSFFIVSLSFCLCAAEKRLLINDPDVVQSLQNELHTLRSKVQQLETAVSENALLKSKLTRLEDELANVRHTVVPGE